MNHLKQNRLQIALACILILAAFTYIRQREVAAPPVATVDDSTMTLNIYIQDKEAAKMGDCRITKKTTHEFPKTSAVADASLKFLFADELAEYGQYKSLVIMNGVAKVTLASDRTPSGRSLASLSSCQIGHLQAVLDDTLKQYESIWKVEIYGKNGKVSF